MKRDPLADPTASIRRVYSYVAYRIGAGADAEDVTSETMVRALRYRTSYDTTKGTPSTWLLAIARACVSDHLSNRTTTYVEDLDPAAPIEVEADVVNRVAVAVAISRLDDRDRELIALRYAADLSTREIAAVLCLSRGTVDVAIHRARKRLSEELHREGYRRKHGLLALHHASLGGI